MVDTNRLGLPYLAAAQAQKHVTHNEALRQLDALVQLSVIEARRNAPPPAPAEGDRYLVGSAPTGAFAGRADHIAAFDDGTWRFFAPRAGWLAHVGADQTVLIHDGSAWRNLATMIARLDNLTGLGIGTASDTANRLAAKLTDALFAARSTGEGGSGDLRFKLNKDGVGNTVSQLYQRAYSGRAETGLLGDDRYRVKVSADGATWRDLLVGDPATGAASFPGGIGDSAGGPVAGLRNLLLNGDFVIAQRGEGPFQRVAAGAGYAFDGWVLRADGAATLALARAPLRAPSTRASGPNGAFSATLTVTTAPAGALPAIEARLEDAARLAGRQITLSFWYRQAAAAFDLAFFQDLDAGAGREAAPGGTLALVASAAWRRQVLTLVMPAIGARPLGSNAHTIMRIALRGAAPAAIELADLQIEEGAIGTPFERRPPALEMLLARRQFRRYATARVVGDLAFVMRATPVQSGGGPFDYSAEL
jgi:hypothetical protein